MLIEQKMEQFSFPDAAELNRHALTPFGETLGTDFDDLDSQSRAAIDEAEGQYQRGEDFAMMKCG